MLDAIGADDGLVSVDPDVRAAYRARMRIAWVATIVLFAVAPSTAPAETLEEQEEREALRLECRDGQEATADLPCDFDGRVDGSCRFFGPRTERHVDVDVGETTMIQRHVRAYLTCRAARK